MREGESERERERLLPSVVEALLPSSECSARASILTILATPLDCGFRITTDTCILLVSRVLDVLVKSSGSRPEP